MDPVPRHPAANMAWDEALLCSTETPVLRVYQWAAPAVSYGYFQKWSEVAAMVRDLPHVRRWTGGGIVHHGQDWTYSLMVPREDPFFQTRVKESYHRIHQILAHTLVQSGCAATLSVTPARSGKECFQAPVAFDVMLDNRKIAGAAQRRGRHGLLHQGSLQRANLSPAFPEIFASHLSSSFQLSEPSEETARQAESLGQHRYANPAWQRRF